ncbi:MAG: peptidoglycan DD-metalloendopeptidase family protein [Deltaproteobacteria bacterium]|nr:peptidoglycan DD-metalloendopeptidase family protein [Candidatus Zymogenaceae bacterium]
MKRIGAISYRLLLLLSLFMLASCVTTTSGTLTTGVYHTVEKGQTLWRISKTYGVDMQLIAEYNDIYNPDLIYEGQELFIPSVSEIKKVIVPEGDTNVGEIILNKGLFLWPTEGLVYSLFGMRWGRMHRGMDISGKSGTPVLAARDGTVTFAGVKGGYGNIVILSHQDGYETRYAHLSSIKASVGDTVKTGDVIGLMGSTGRSTGPHLHFEIRKDDTARNPLFFLP